MASKPSLTPRWANVGGDITEPASGKKDIGHVVAEKPPAQYLNWLFNLAWQWFEYLKDGAFSGATTFDSTVGVTGATTLSSTLGVTGAATLTGGIANNVTLLAGITAAADQHVTVSGTGRLKHGNRVRSVPIANVIQLGSFTASATDARHTSNAGTTDLRFLIPAMDTGQRIRSIAMSCSGDTFVGATLRLQIYSSGALSGTHDNSASNIASLPTLTQITISSIDYTLLGGEVLVVTIDPTATALVAYSLTLTYDVP